MSYNQYNKKYDIKFKAGTKEYLREWKKKNKDKIKQYQKDSKDKVMELRNKAYIYGGNCCKICNYNKCQSALHFHHINQNDKKYQISDAISRHEIKDIEELKIELDKCILLCSNCHAELHEKDRNELKGDI